MTCSLYNRKEKKDRPKSTTVKEWKNKLWYTPKVGYCGIIKGIN